MDDADSTLLQSLFAENNELRARNHVLQREIASKSILIDSQEEQLYQLRKALDLDKSKNHPPKKVSQPITSLNVSTNGSKELEDAMYALDRKNIEIRQLKNEVTQLQTDLEAQEAVSDKLEQEMVELQIQVNAMENNCFNGNNSNESHENDEKSLRTGSGRPIIGDATVKQITQLREQLLETETVVERQKKHIQELTTEATHKYSLQQSQLQGLEALLEQVKQQYEEFITVTKLENDAYKQAQSAEYDALKLAFETHKKEQYDEKRSMMLEHHAMLFTMQALFDEYKKTCEFLFNTESAKLEDELINQSVRYEHEILYIIQAKDKFYSDMMVSKDAKIMKLVEGSDLTSLFQKHEMEIDAVRKEYTQELERIKSKQESEQKQVINLLQRQNASLESKADKLSQHIKALETKIKDLIGAIENKTKAINERDELRMQLEIKHAAILEQEKLKYSQILQEKEYLRHKVIRLNMESKGTGKNTIENILKRISRETTDLSKMYTDMESQFEDVTEQRNKLERQVKERDRWIEYLEREVSKRTNEFNLLTSTFEQFLAQRARQARIDRLRRLNKLQLHTSGSNLSDSIGNHNDIMVISNNNCNNISGTNTASGLNFTVQPLSKETVKIRIPDLATRTRANEIEELTMEQQEMDRAKSYLKRFQTMSRAFATGEYKKLSYDMNLSDENIIESTKTAPGGGIHSIESNTDNVDTNDNDASSPTKNIKQLVSLYKESTILDATSSSYRMYVVDDKTNGSLTTPMNAVNDTHTVNHGRLSPIRVYDYESRTKTQIQDVNELTKQGMMGAFKGGMIKKRNNAKPLTKRT